MKVLKALLAKTTLQLSGTVAYLMMQKRVSLIFSFHQISLQDNIALLINNIIITIKILIGVDICSQNFTQLEELKTFLYVLQEQVLVKIFPFC